MDNITDKKELDCKSIVYKENKNEFNRYEVDVPFVPTPLNIVRQMLTIANISSNDILYDLGCGDGRVVITAAKEFEAYAIGYDIDPQQINECVINAQTAGVSGKVSFLNKNIFDAQITDATVIFLYLLTNINVRLRTKLLTELKSGTRILSHDFNMDSWLPDEKVVIDNHMFYTWIIPANFTGTWHWSMPKICGGGHCSLKIKQHFQIADAHFHLSFNFYVENIAIRANKIEIRCHVHIDSREIFFKLEGTIVKNTIKGSVFQNGIQKQEWRADRNPLTINPFF